MQSGTAGPGKHGPRLPPRPTSVTKNQGGQDFSGVRNRYIHKAPSEGAGRARSKFVRNMKLRSICFPIFAVWAIAAAHAQIMPDSTLQITAYWQEGDRMTYDYMSTECLIEDGDTLHERRTRATCTFDVVKATPTRYTLRITAADRRDDDPVVQQICDLEQQRGLNMPLVIETSQHGELLCVVNAAQIVEAAQQLVDIAATDFYGRLPAADRDRIPQWEWRNMLEKWINPPTATTQTMEDLSRIFFFHGSKFRTDGEYERRETLRVPASDAEADAVTTFWADPSKTDNTSAMLHTYSESNAEKAVRAVAASRPEALLLGGTVAPEQLADTRIEMESFSGEEIHFATGWPLQTYWSTRLTASPPDGRKVTITVRKQLTRRDDNATTDPASATGGE